MKMENTFNRLRKTKKAAFMAHVYYGDPNEEFSIKLIKNLMNRGVDIIEFGIPFSDPSADGPTFIKACNRSLKNGMNVKKSIQGIKKIRKINADIPIIVTSCFNIVYQYGVGKFIIDIKKSGAQGLIIPEAVIEESTELQKFGDKYNVDIIHLIGPSSSEERIRKIADKATGFLYLVSVAGVTGVRKNISNSIELLIEKMRKYTNLPLLVGFGISKPEHVITISNSGADGVIIGSAIGKIYEKYLFGNIISGEEKCLNEISDFITSIKGVC